MAADRKWSEAELAASVAAYQQMLKYQAAGTRFRKAEIYQALANSYGRTTKAYEYRMQNISAVLAAHQRPIVEGLLPAKNVGAGVVKKLEVLLGLSIPGPRAKKKSAAYEVKLPAMRSWLIGVARNRGVVRYGDVMSTFDIDRFSLRFALGKLGRQSRDLEEPVLTALVVNKATGHCSRGLQSEFGIEDDAGERAKLYAHWAKKKNADTEDKGEEGVDKRAARFAEVEVRPDQAAFRKAVYKACEGKCVISRCDVPEALDAAHKRDRDWRLGHNSAEDGYLLRKDIHALYDKGLIDIGADGEVTVHGEARTHYGKIHGSRVGGQ